MVSFSGACTFPFNMDANENEYDCIMEDQQLFHYLSQTGGKYNDECIAIAGAAKILPSQGRPLTNKALIDSLLGMLTSCEDVVTCDIIRHALEIVVEFTGDDI